MPLEFRSTTPGDLARIQALLQTAFSMCDDSPALDDALLRWKYWEHGTMMTGSRSYALEQDGNLVAHGSLWPVEIPGVTAANLLDWAATRMPPGAGVSLIRRLSDVVQVLVSSGGSAATRAIMPRIGFRHVGNQNVYVRVLRPWKQYRTRPREPVQRAIPRLLRNISWSVAPAVALRGWSAQAVDAGAVCDAPSKHLLKCPGAAVSACSLDNGRGGSGYFLLSRVGGQSRIARLRLNSRRRDDWVAAFALAAATALNDPAACELVAVSSNALLNEALDANHFHYRDQRPFFVYDPRKLIAPGTALEFDMLDDDMPYLNIPEYPYFA